MCRFQSIGKTKEISTRTRVRNLRNVERELQSYVYIVCSHLKTVWLQMYALITAAQNIENY